jgi:hypothetical protein
MATNTQEDNMSVRLKAVLALSILTIMLAMPSAVAEDKPVQLALLNPVQLVPESNSISGLRLSLLYGRNVSVTGVDLGLVNHTTSGITTGFQWGFVNVAEHASGFQLGFVNYARSMKGLQIGLVNIIEQGGLFPVLPIINWSF